MLLVPKNKRYKSKINHGVYKYIGAKFVCVGSLNGQLSRWAIFILDQNGSDLNVVCAFG